MFKGINAIEFSKRFQTNEDCYRYLMNLKWGN
ncbi:MAG: IS1595 family transposase, partial [Sphingobacteriales bacterium]|nr:IS1595 family transposase [Sphingobacteriales bacterium]